MGGDYFACEHSSYCNSLPGWKAFDSSTSTYWQSANENQKASLTWYSPEPVKISSVSVKSNMYTFNVFASNTNGNWLLVGQRTTSSGTGTFTVPIDTDGKYYYYYKVQGVTADYVHLSIYNITINGTYLYGANPVEHVWASPVSNKYIIRY